MLYRCGIQQMRSCDGGDNRARTCIRITHTKEWWHAEFLRKKNQRRDKMERILITLENSKVWGAYWGGMLGKIKKPNKETICSTRSSNCYHTVISSCCRVYGYLGEQDQWKPGQRQSQLDLKKYSAAVCFQNTRRKERNTKRRHRKQSRLSLRILSVTMCASQSSSADAATPVATI
jgi:hypothetical protein